ncbi:MAG: hypothetical protein ACREL4_01285 [Gemmatimonadales bacterium]
MQDVLAIFLIFGGGTAIAISFSPIGAAIAARIRGQSAVPESDPQVLAELDDLRGELAELQERMDFSERLLGQVRPRDAADAGGEN